MAETSPGGNWGPAGTTWTRRSPGALFSASGEGAIQKRTSAAGGAWESLPAWGTSTSVPSPTHLTALARRVARVRGPGTGRASAAQMSDLCRGLATFLLLRKPCLFGLHVDGPGLWGPPADPSGVSLPPRSPRSLVAPRLLFLPLQGRWSVRGQAHPL